jgi:hypothetical protein
MHRGAHVWSGLGGASIACIGVFGSKFGLTSGVPERWLICRWCPPFVRIRIYRIGRIYRMLWDLRSGAVKEVTVYIDGGFEYIYEINGSGAVTEEFNELHVMDGRSRVARVKVFGATWSGSVADGIRYNLEDHLGNAGFTLDATGSLINREEYFAGVYPVEREGDFVWVFC